MSLQSHLTNLRAKPEHIRKRYAFWGSLGITAVIFAFWLASFTTYVATPKALVTTAVAKAGSPGQSLIAGVGAFFTDISDLIFGSKKVTYPSIEVLPGKK